MTSKITCIIPAYNEEKRIGNILKIVSGSKIINEIIVVNDGSKDKTSNVVKKFKRVKLISLKKNVGKTKALLGGIKKAKGNYILLLDADLVGFTKENIHELINPVINQKADVSISLTNKRKISRNLFDLLVLLSGQRAFKKNLINHEKFSNLPNYGFEAAFNSRIMQDKLRVKFVPMPNVKNTAKVSKDGLVKGLLKEIGMMRQIIKSVGIVGCAKQMLFLRSRSID